MSHASLKISTHFLQPMSAQDLEEIAKGAAMLPGVWIVEPAPDKHVESTRFVWLNPALQNSIAMSLGITKQKGIFWVYVRHHNKEEAFDREGTPYGDLSTAFSTLGEILMMFRGGPKKRGEIDRAYISG